MWIDTHCHLNASDFQTKDGQDERPAVLARARAAGVRQMLVIGSGQGWPEIETAVTLASQDSDLYAAIAVHPHDAAILQSERDEQKAHPTGEQLWRKIEDLAHSNKRVLAVGETGLDFYYQHATPTDQINVFRKFLHLAHDTQKPLSLHIRDAHKEALEMVREMKNLSGVVHCFTGTVSEAQAWIDLGFFLSFSGIVTFPKATQVQEACKATPLDRMVLETDCPYLSPAPMRGKRNEPAFLVHTAAYVSQLKNISIDELAAQTTQNAAALFGLPRP